MFRRRHFRSGFRRVYPWSFRLRYEIWEMHRGPDGIREGRFRPLHATHPALDRRMREAFVQQWLTPSGFPEWRSDDALATVDIRLARRRFRRGRDLRITSTFLGSTDWLYAWSGDEGEAIELAAEFGGAEVYRVLDERRINGRTEWD